MLNLIKTQCPVTRHTIEYLLDKYLLKIAISMLLLSMVISLASAAELKTGNATGIRIIAPDEAPLNSPVQITAIGIPEGTNVAYIWRLFPKFPNDVWLEVYDRASNPVNIYWSLEPG